MINFNNAEFVKSAFSKEDHLLDLPQILFIGKSNVGKSSLINALTDRKNLAYISKKPGQTKLVNYYLINKKFYLVDVPGFGYRKIAREKDAFEEMMEGYFSSNTSLKAVFYLIDSRRELLDEEFENMDFIKSMNLPLYLVFTKCDKLNQSEKAKLINSIKKHSIDNYLFVSINNKSYLEKLKECISLIIE